MLDASAVLRFLDGEAGAARVNDIFHQAGRGECLVIISAVNWGEVIGILSRKVDAAYARQQGLALTGLGLTVIAATAERAERAALIKVTRGIPYADSFGVELAGDSSSHTLITADFDAKPAEDDIHIEFLPTKPSHD